MMQNMFDMKKSIKEQQQLLTQVDVKSIQKELKLSEREKQRLREKSRREERLF